MISVSNLKVEFGVTPLFSGASFVINERDRIALVGKNGAGKSTLLKILAGLQHPTEGEIGKGSETSVGYLPQVMILQDDTTVREETQKAFAPLIKMQSQLETMGTEMAERDDYDSESYMQLVEKFTHIQDRYQMLGGETMEADVERTLLGLGFLREDLSRPTSEFSGGWRMRIELAKILLKKPDVLLLDEPTNHLDIESIQWLEQQLSQTAQAVVLVSHDKAFINNVTNRTLEISCGKIIDYKVNYDEYIKLRVERREQQLRAYENQQKEIADTKAFIERFRYQATKAIQVQQRIRQLEKIVPIEVDEVDNSALHLKFAPCLRSGDYPLICNEVAKSYGEHMVFQHANLTIKRGEKVAFVGRNGEGKSTLVKCIMNEIPFDGELKIGHNIQIGYFAQNQAQMLDENLTIYETIDRVARGEIRLKINNILGAFMFGGEASEKKVKVLSGGERSRLAMIRLLLEPVNMLILDEPTNHLDIASKEVLKEAINSFEGTAIIVSHDRDFLDGLVDKVFEFGGGTIKEHLGGIYDFLQSKQIASLQELEKRNNLVSNKQVVDKTGNSSNSANGAADWQAQKELRRKEQKLKRKIEECEQHINELEAALNILNDQLQTPEGASNIALLEKHSRMQSQLNSCMEEWEEASEELENLHI